MTGHRHAGLGAAPLFLRTRPLWATWPTCSTGGSPSTASTWCECTWLHAQPLLAGSYVLSAGRCRYPHALFFLDMLQSAAFRSSLARNDVAVRAAGRRAGGTCMHRPSPSCGTAGLFALDTVLLLAASQEERAAAECTAGCAQLTGACAGRLASSAESGGVPAPGGLVRVRGCLCLTQSGWQPAQLAACAFVHSTAPARGGAESNDVGFSPALPATPVQPWHAAMCTRACVHGPAAAGHHLIARSSSEPPEI